jgi:hypothetical protein
VFRVATDIPHYAAWTLERVLRAPDLVWTAERADDWRLSWAGWTQTRYEAKALREGRTPAYFIFRRADFASLRHSPHRPEITESFTVRRQNKPLFGADNALSLAYFAKKAMFPVSIGDGYLITVIIDLFESGPRPGPALFYYLRTPCRLQGSGQNNYEPSASTHDRND